MTPKRLAVLDLVRGLAVVAMAVYHFSWDLSWFGFVDWPVSQGAGWRDFAETIAASFLFVSGIGLDLAHHRGIRWRSFVQRLAKIVLAAAGVSLATYFAFEENYVRFGILHCIAVSSLIALPFVRLSWAVSGIAALFVLTLPLWAQSFAFNGQLWLWTGLGTPDFGSVDYVPLAPWAGVTLAGLAVSAAFRTFGIWQRLTALRFENAAGRFARLLGRYSLPIYLIHQPVLYGLVWAVFQVNPAADRDALAFVKNCTLACQDSFGAPDICEAACGCTLEFLKTDGIWTALLVAPEEPGLQDRMNRRYAQCLADPEAFSSLDSSQK
ncbi:heparan-alpha-glucosaminide N-acetyltransferase [Roseibium aggregatum]|uniref:DUF1624 domain-containing protein n=1 Tax=Roseibium aggregatum TaxID=187304 RepID=A0A939EJI8_9HYPH|nr:heparan-alpha-glucosaminide N-acetyltransferase [Roseibium aggregatum]MBN9673567.1 DUF1624 domain-containing protein [Roseibium aggregatum]